MPCPNILGANARNSHITGVDFCAGYRSVLAENSLIMDSDDDALGLMALCLATYEAQAVEYLSAICQLFYSWA